MKTMTCRQLGGRCDMAFQASTFEEIAEQSKQHGMDMFRKKDPAHLQAMQEMQDLMKAPDEMQKWFEGKRIEFDNLPES